MKRFATSLFAVFTLTSCVSVSRDAGLNERWTGRHVLKIVVHAPNGPHAGRRIWPPL